MKHAGMSYRRLLSALLIAILMVSISVPAFAASKGDILNVSEDFARLRAKPESGSDVLAKLRKGAKVIFLGEERGWCKLELGNGKQGYMYKDMLKSYSTPKVGKLYHSRLSSGKLPVYSKPNTKSKKKGTLKASTDVVLLQRKGFWGLIRVVKNGQVGYVNIKYLKGS